MQITTRCFQSHDSLSTSTDGSSRVGVRASGVLVARDSHRRFLSLNLSVGENEFDDFGIVGRAKDGFEFLLRRSTEDSLGSLAGVEAVEGVDEFDEGDRSARRKSASMSLDLGYKVID